MTMPDPQATPFDPKGSTSASDFSAPAEQIPAPEVPAPEAPSFPQSSAPDFDEATATPGSTSYGTAYDAAGAQSFPGPEQPAYGSAGYSDPAYGQPAYGQPAYGQQAYANPPKQWIIALLLAFFVGPLGIHNFYLGYNSRGLIQLILSVIIIGLPITAIWALIEFIMIIMRSGSYGCDASGQPLV